MFPDIFYWTTYINTVDKFTLVYACFPISNNDVEWFCFSLLF